MYNEPTKRMLVVDKYTFRPARPDEQNPDLCKTEPFGHYKPNLFQNLIIKLFYGTVFGRGWMRQWLSNLVARLGKPIDVTREGGNFRLYLDNNLIDYGLLLRKDYNGVELAFLREHLNSTSVAVDIGCNIGLYTLQLATTGAHVVSIDPNPMMIKQLRFNIDASSMDKVSVFECAVGDTTGKADLHIRNDDLAIVSVKESEAGSVLVKTLENILQEAGVKQIDSLKIDVEGYEDKALAPFLMSCSEQMLPKRIVIEEQSEFDHPECQKAFRQRGYKFLKLNRNNTLYELQPT
ncbi:MAG: FkbM family methyltransferase [Rhizobiales bacterium]|nr:FkbM family methyltransferase [Hyphomicrobiales bacterium]